MRATSFLGTQAPKTNELGAIISGFKMLGQLLKGPLEVVTATTGAGFVSKKVSLNFKQNKGRSIRFYIVDHH
jgi:hypothetical protein